MSISAQQHAADSTVIISGQAKADVKLMELSGDVFTASLIWQCHYMATNKLLIRCHTHISQIHPSDHENMLTGFHQFIMDVIMCFQPVLPLFSNSDGEVLVRINII